MAPHCKSGPWCRFKPSCNYYHPEGGNYIPKKNNNTNRYEEKSPRRAPTRQTEVSYAMGTWGHAMGMSRNSVAANTMNGANEKKNNKQNYSMDKNIEKWPGKDGDQKDIIARNEMEDEKSDEVKAKSKTKACKHKRLLDRLLKLVKLNLGSLRDCSESEDNGEDCDFESDDSSGESESEDDLEEEEEFEESEQDNKVETKNKQEIKGNVKEAEEESKGDQKLGADKGSRKGLKWRVCLNGKWCRFKPRCRFNHPEGGNDYYIAEETDEKNKQVKHIDKKEENLSSKIQSCRVPHVPRYGYGNDRMLEEVDMDAYNGFLKEQLDLFGGCKELYSRVANSLDRGKLVPGLKEEQKALYFWRENFFKKHFKCIHPEGRIASENTLYWTCEGSGDEQLFDTVPFQITGKQRFDTVMKLAASTVKFNSCCELLFFGAEEGWSMFTEDESHCQEDSINDGRTSFKRRGWEEESEDESCCYN